MTRRFYLFLIPFTIFLITSCGHWGWEDVESDHEPTLNVLAMILLGGEEETFVTGFQTL